jgi:hypothetical protein
MDYRKKSVVNTVGVRVPSAAQKSLSGKILKGFFNLFE